MTSSTFFANVAAGYELQMGRWSRCLAPPLIEFVGVEEGDRVLDVGCGTGSLAGSIAAMTKAKRIEGVDVAAPYVTHAVRTYQDPRLGFSVGDACALKFPDGVFECVLSSLVLQFVPSPLLAVSEMRRVASPGGRVAASVWDLKGGMAAGRVFLDTAATLDAEADAFRARHLTRPMTRPGDLAKAWHSVGLTDVTETEISIRMEFKDFDDYWAPYVGQDGPIAEYVRGISTQKRETLKLALRRAYLGGEQDGPRSFVAVAWAVKGTVPA